MMCLRIRSVLLSSRGIMCSCKTPAREEKRRGPWGSACPCPGAHSCWGEQEGGTGEESVQKVLQWWLIRRCILKGYIF